MLYVPLDLVREAAGVLLHTWGAEENHNAQKSFYRHPDHEDPEGGRGRLLDPGGSLDYEVSHASW